MNRTVFRSALESLRATTGEAYRLLSCDCVGLLFPCLLSVLFPLVLVGFRFWTGAGLGLSQAPRPDGAIPTGIVFNYLDNLSYASWAQQAKFASPLGSILYTTEPHPAGYLNVLFVALGLVARWLGTPVMGLLNVAGLVGTGIAIFAVYHIALRMRLTESAARWSVVWLIAGSGCSAMVRVVCSLLEVSSEPYVGTDSFYFDAFGFSAFLIYPYHAFSIGWMSLMIWLVMIIEDYRSPARQGLQFLLLGILTLGMSFVHPYEGHMAVASYVAYAAIGARGTEGYTRRRRAIALTLLVPTLIGDGYAYWLVQSGPVWDHFARASLSIQYSRLAWLVGYGFILPIALVGVGRVIWDDRIAKARWMASWTLLLLFLLIVLNVKVTRLSNGAQVPISLMAGTGWAYLLDRVRGWEPKWRRKLGYVAAAVVGGVLVSQNVALLWGFSGRSSAHVVEADLAQAAAVIRRLAHSPLPIVLCDVTTGAVLPGIAGFRVYAGHSPLTFGFAAKTWSLSGAGFNPAQDTPSLDLGRIRAAFEGILVSSRADFVLLKMEATALQFASTNSKLDLVGSFGRWRVFAVLRKEGPPEALRLGLP
jgi:hypothetical protein